MPEPIGQTLGHYRVLAKLGEGWMGMVHRAHGEHLDREAAICLTLGRLDVDPILDPLRDHPPVRALLAASGGDR